MIKRIIGILLAMSLCLSNFCVSYAETEVDLEISRRFRVLNQLHIINERQQGDYGVYRNMSKSAFINFICNILGDYGYTEVYDETAIELAESFGLIHEGQDDLYKPLYYDEAMTMLVRMLGYTTHAEAYHGYPYGYTTIANRLGLADGIAASPGERMQEYDAITLLYNAINCAYVEIISFSDEGITYGSTSDNTLLYEYRKIYKVSGVLQSTEKTSISEQLQTDKGKIMIQGYVYETDKDFSDFVGMNVEAYVQGNKTSADKVLVAEPVRNEEITVAAADLEDVSPDLTEITYWNENGKLKTLRLSPVRDVIYNGQCLRGATRNHFLNADGQIRLIDNDGNSGYDVAIITDYQTVVVESVSKLNESVANIYTYDNTNKTVSFKEESNDIIDIYDEESAIGFSDILPGDVLSIAMSTVNGRKVILAHRENNKITGTVSAIRTVGGETVVGTDHGEYTLSKTYEKALAAMPKDPKAKEIRVGASYDFYFDFTGKIAYLTDADNSLQYALVYATAAENGFNQKCLIKVFTTEGEWKEFYFADKIKYNDQSGTVKPSDILANIPTGRNGQVSVIKYTTNSEGKINSLHLPVVRTKVSEISENDEFNVIQKNNKIRYYAENNSFNSEVFVESNAFVWTIDESAMQREESYSIGAASPFVADWSYKYAAYNVDEFGFSDLFVGLRDEATTDSEMEFAQLFMVDSVSKTVNSKGESVSMISGAFKNYESLTFFCEEDVSVKEEHDPTMTTDDTAIGLEELRKGDIIAVHMNNLGNADRIVRYRGVGDGTDNTVYTDVETLYHKGAILQGTVSGIGKNKDRMEIDCGGAAPRVIRVSSATPVIIYSLEHDSISIGTVADIEEGARIFTRLQWFKTSSILIYQ